MKFLKTVVCFLVCGVFSLPAHSQATPRAASLDCVDRMATVEGNRSSTSIDVVKLQPGNRMPGLAPGEPSRFVVSVVVDTVGRADSATIQLPAGLDSISGNAIRSVLPAWRFIPARLGGCSVKQVVRLTFTRK
jgi:hypothetical protein